MSLALISPSLQNDAYKYPDVLVCPRWRHGCDSGVDERDCVYSFNMTQGTTQATFNSGSEHLDIELRAGFLEDVSGSYAAFPLQNNHLDKHG